MEIYFSTIVLTLEIPILVSIILLFINKNIFTKMIIETTKIQALLISNFIYISICIIGNWLFTLEFNWFGIYELKKWIIINSQNIFNLIVVIYTIVLLHQIIFRIYVRIFKIFVTNIEGNFSDLTLIYSEKIISNKKKNNEKILREIIDLQFILFKILLFDNNIDNKDKKSMLDHIYELNIKICSKLNLNEVSRFLKYYQEYTYPYIHDGISWYSEVKAKNREFILNSIKINRICLAYWDNNIEWIDDICKLSHYSEEELTYLFKLRFEIETSNLNCTEPKLNLYTQLEEYLNYNLINDRHNHSRDEIISILNGIKLETYYGDNFKKYKLNIISRINEDTKSV